MITGFRHRGLQLFFEEGDHRGINPNHRNRIGRILDVLDFAETISDVDVPGFRLHPLRGDMEGFWSVRVSGNWRGIFCFGDAEASEVDLVDYH